MYNYLATVFLKSYSMVMKFSKLELFQVQASSFKLELQNHIAKNLSLTSYKPPNLFSAIYSEINTVSNINNTAVKYKG